MHRAAVGVQRAHLVGEAGVGQLDPQVETVRRQLADDFGCDPEEIAITRNASEALEICQYGIDLKPGDEVLTTNQDYPRMLNTWRQRERREGIEAGGSLL